MFRIEDMHKKSREYVSKCQPVNSDLRRSRTITNNVNAKTHPAEIEVCVIIQDNMHRSQDESEHMFDVEHTYLHFINI